MEKEEMKNELEDSCLCGECERLKCENKNLQRLVSQLDDRLQCLEDRYRQKNLLFYGIPRRHAPSGFKQDVQEIVHKVMGLGQDVNVEHVYRCGTAVVVRFASRCDRDLVLSRVKCLRGTRFSVREDVSPTVRQQQKGLLPLYKDLRKQNKRANIYQDRLVTGEGVFTYDLNTQTVVRVEESRGGGSDMPCYTKCTSRLHHPHSMPISSGTTLPTNCSQRGTGNLHSSHFKPVDRPFCQQRDSYPSNTNMQSDYDTTTSHTADADTDQTRVLSPLSNPDTTDMLDELSMDSGISTLTASTLPQSSYLSAFHSSAATTEPEGKATADNITSDKNSSVMHASFPNSPALNNSRSRSRDWRCSKREGKTSGRYGNCGDRHVTSVIPVQDDNKRFTENKRGSYSITEESYTQTDSNADVSVYPNEYLQFENGQGQLPFSHRSYATQTGNCSPSSQGNFDSERDNCKSISTTSSHTVGAERTERLKQNHGDDRDGVCTTGPDVPGHATLPAVQRELKSDPDGTTEGSHCNYHTSSRTHMSSRTDKMPESLERQDTTEGACHEHIQGNNNDASNVGSGRSLRGSQQGNGKSNTEKTPMPLDPPSATTSHSHKPLTRSSTVRAEAERDVGWHRSGGQWQYTHKRATGDAGKHPANREALKANLECVVPPSPTSPSPAAALVNGNGDGGGRSDGGGEGVGSAGGRRSTVQEQDHISLKLTEMKDSILQPIKEDLSEWITRIIGVQITPDTFLEVLDSGVALCTISKLIEKHAQDYAKQGKLTEPLPSFKLRCNSKAKSGTWFSRDNVTNYLGWCRAYGMTDETMFDSEDLVSHKQEKPVVNCVLELARIGWKFGIEPPNLIRMEREIEKQAEEFEPPPYVPPPPPPPPPLPPPPVVEKLVEPPVEVKKPEKIELHKEVKRLAHKCKCQEYVNRISEGVYDVFGRRVFIRLLHGKHLMVRVGGGWDTFENYLLHHDPIQVYEFRRPSSRENLKQDFEGFLVIRSKYKS